MGTAALCQAFKRLIHAITCKALAIVLHTPCEGIPVNVQSHSCTLDNVAPAPC